MKIITEDLSALELEMLNNDLKHSEIREVASKKEAYEAIENHFGTLKCKSDDHITDDGELWIVYPPQGVYASSLYILIKTK